MPMQDVFVETFSENRLVVISPSAHSADEELIVHVAMSHGLETHRATLISSEPISVAGTVAFRLELRVDRVDALASEEQIH
jgi:hypothetical protein